jgi:hypothetical protein
VALNWGLGSSSLNAEVKAFDRLHIVLGWKSSCSGAKYSSCTRRARCLGGTYDISKGPIDSYLCSVFSTIWGVCFRSADNLNPLYRNRFDTVLIQKFKLMNLSRIVEHSSASARFFYLESEADAVTWMWESTSAWEAHRSAAKKPARR